MTQPIDGQSGVLADSQFESDVEFYSDAEMEFDEAPESSELPETIDSFPAVSSPESDASLDGEIIDLEVADEDEDSPAQLAVSFCTSGC